MEYKTPSISTSKSGISIKPRLIIHGGAGNITPSNLPPSQHQRFSSALLQILCDTHNYLLFSPHGNALDTATHAVTLLENNPLFNSGHGAVFTRTGTNELEASVMVSAGKKKRGVGIMGLTHVKNPIRLAREMLLRGEHDLDGGNGEHRGPMVDVNGEFEGQPPSGGAQGHEQLFGESAENLAREWGLEMVESSYFFTQHRWDEHVAGLEREKSGAGLPGYHTKLFVPQGTCGAVALDAEGVCAVATSTGGMTNKLAGRIGDTPTLGAGFWAEEWIEECLNEGRRESGPMLIFSETLKGLLADCWPSLSTYVPVGDGKSRTTRRSTAISGTGNGDSFLRMNAVRTASAIVRYGGKTSLQKSVSEMSGPDGELQKSAGSRWKKTGEGEGGMIGIESVLVEDADGILFSTTSHVVNDYNCGGMFRAFVNEDGKAVFRVWRPNQYSGLEKYESEGKEYEVKDWQSEKR